MWSVFIYYDYLDPQSCEMREYVFTTEEMAEGFRLQAVEVHEMIFVSPSFYNYLPMEHSCFLTIEDAIDDVSVFVDREKRSQYEHPEEIQLISMDHLRFLIYRSECVYLEEENKMLRCQLEKYKEKKTK